MDGLVFLAIVLLPIAAFCSLESGEFSKVCGLGYFGQPHIQARFMSIKSIKILLCNIMFTNKQDGVDKMFDFVMESVKNKEDIR